MLNERWKQQPDHSNCELEKQKAIAAMEKMWKQQVTELEIQVKDRDEILKKFNVEWKSITMQKEALKQENERQLTEIFKYQEIAKLTQAESEQVKREFMNLQQENHELW